MSFSLNQLYQSLGISKQAVHKNHVRYQQKHEEQMHLLNIIYQVRSDHPTMGMRDLYHHIQPKMLGRDAFEALCKSYNLWSIRPKNYQRTTDSSGVIRFDNLIAGISLNNVNQVWQSDITYYQLKDRFYYITFVLDAYSRRIVGHQTSTRLTTEQTTLPALQMAINTRTNQNLQGLIFHSDGGGQYYSKEFLTLTKRMKMVNSMCEYPWENGKAERINGVIKNNYLKHRKIETFEDLQKEVDRAVLLYNRDKPHIALQRKSPITFEQELVLLQ